MAESAAGGGRIALGVAYRGGAYQGWQSQPGGRTVQDALEGARDLLEEVIAKADGALKSKAEGMLQALG